MTDADALLRGREAFARRAWAEAHAHLSAAGGAAPLEGEDLERLAAAAYLIGRHKESIEVWTRAYQGWTQLGASAARPAAPSGSPLDC